MVSVDIKCHVYLLTYWCVQGFVYNTTEASRLQQQAEVTQWDADRGLGLQRSPPRAGHDVPVELPLALVLLSLGLWENYLDGEFRWGLYASLSGG